MTEGAGAERVRLQAVEVAEEGAGMQRSLHSRSDLPRIVGWAGVQRYWPWERKLEGLEQQQGQVYYCARQVSS